MRALTIFGIAIGATGVIVLLHNANYSGAAWAAAYLSSQITMLALVSRHDLPR